MQLESHATPASHTPEQRYAQLHRAIENGLASDTVWKELAEVSLTLGHTDEAVRCSRRIGSIAMRAALESQLARQGLIDLGPGHRGAPAASNAGPHGGRGAHSAPDPDDEGATLQDHLADAAQFLFVQHMPWLFLLTTLAFPLIFGVGGFLTQGESPLGLAAIATLPGICVLTLIGAMCRRTLLDSSRGIADVPGVPQTLTLVVDALRFATDVVVTIVLCAMPFAAGCYYELPWPALAGAIALGGLLAPMTFCICTLQGAAAALSPVLVMRAVVIGGLSYLGLATVVTIMLLPLALVAWFSLGQPAWVQIAAIGPATTLPLFFGARLLGTWIDVRRNRLGSVLGLATQARRAPQSWHKSRRASRDRGAARPPRPRRNASTERRNAAKPRPERTAPTSVEPTPAARLAAHAAGIAPRPDPAQQTVHAIEGLSPRSHASTEDLPDLQNLPGAITVSGRDRVTSGAAARKR